MGAGGRLQTCPNVLIRESATADLLVLGHRGRGGFAALLLGSVAIKVAAHAACPVLITRGPPPAGGDVVVGVDGSAAGGAAIGFAFQEAALRGVGLRALHAKDTFANLAGLDPGTLDPGQLATELRHQRIMIVCTPVSITLDTGIDKQSEAERAEGPDGRQPRTAPVTKAADPRGPSVGPGTRSYRVW
ncbi:universal stress protein [Amorphoplanes digitatis]|uniref:Nucleotide-binding universal stress UspA family protein n=1 Tax=Actinoplanes digitatis TaxID=1868 RepID=A0A7W7MSR1_9ACTN|nr:nucleotide-binding universal stress UspA family protein [Actinoplanes digitatis]GID98222.1 hypothetical protein Adi01nite_76340 [Actinoplanes digitatis]